MPLSRYEITSEYSLANPDLYRAAEKDDPEGLLEGVAMAGLVGIIRQLGDLAEFAAEVFHDLHEDVVATAARSHELGMRVRQLEREVPLLEKMMFNREIDCRNFMYNPGMEWHVHIHNEQNHFTRGDLPRFIRSAYEDCRSPPRLFVLDRFDVTGAGACLKRFTDPSFFKMEWASSELLKAEKEQRDHKARRLKRKGQRQGNGEAREAMLAPQKRHRLPIVNEDASRSSVHSSSSNSSGIFEQEVFNLLKQENEDMLTASSSLLSGQEGSQVKGTPTKNARVEALSVEASNLKQAMSTLNSDEDLGLLNGGLEKGMKELEVLVDDSASETDNFMDAVTTMDSEVETDTEMKPRVQLDVDHLGSITGIEGRLPQSTSENSGRAGVEQVLVEDAREQVEDAIEQHLVEDPKKHRIGEEVEVAFVVGGECSTGVLMPEKSHGAEQMVIDNASTVSQEQEDLLFVSGHVVTLLAESIDASPPKSSSSVSSASAEEDVISKSEEVAFPSQTTDLSPPQSPSGASSSSIEEDAAGKSEELPIDNVSRVSAEKEITVVLHGILNIPSPQENGVSTSMNPSGASSPVFEEKVSLSSDMCLQPESNEGVVTSSETLEAICVDGVQGNSPSAQSSQLEGSVFLESQKESSSAPGIGSTRKRWQINTIFNKAMLAPALQLNGSQASEDEGDSCKKSSSKSSPSSSVHSIQAMRWAVGSSEFYHTDDDADCLEGSSGLLSSSSSTLSSPRPSMLVATLQTMNINGKSEPSPLCRRSADSSPPCSPSKLAATTRLHERVSFVKTSNKFVDSPASEQSVHSSPHSPSSPVQPFFDSFPSLGSNLTLSSPEEKAESSSARNVGVSTLDTFPPPPPLPPLAWRMSKRSPSAVVCPSVPMDSPNPSQRQGINEICVDDPLRISSPSATAPVFLNAGFQHGLDDSMQSVLYEKAPSKIKSVDNNFEEIITGPKPFGIERRRSLTFVANTETLKEECVSVLTSSNSVREDIVTARLDSHLPEKLPDKGDPAFLTKVPWTHSIPARLGTARLESETRGNYGVRPLSNQGFSEGQEPSAEATTSSDIYSLRRRSKWALTSNTASSDDREVLLEQIRTRSFSLRNSGAEKLGAPRPVTNINVAAILEKANAIRQAFAGSDEDDDDDEWSDA